MISALFIDPKGPYPAMGLDCWDEFRDARRFNGSGPVICHPPCAAWSKMSGLRAWRYGLPEREDSGCFASALETVHRCGGVLEHPAESKAWAHFGLQKPKFGSWQQSGPRTWITEVWQVDYGHRARKRTWLLYVGDTKPADLRWLKRPHTAVVSGSKNHCSRPVDRQNRVWSREAKRTPPEFAVELLKLAEGARCP